MSDPTTQCKCGHAWNVHDLRHPDYDPCACCEAEQPCTLAEHIDARSGAVPCACDREVRWEDLWDEMEREQEDPLRPARGIALGLLLRIVTWVGIGAAVGFAIAHSGVLP